MCCRFLLLNPRRIRASERAMETRKVQRAEFFGIIFTAARESLCTAGSKRELSNVFNIHLPVAKPLLKACFKGDRLGYRPNSR